MTNKVINSKQQENDVGELGLGLPNIFFSAFSVVRRTVAVDRKQTPKGKPTGQATEDGSQKSEDREQMRDDGRWKINLRHKT